MQIITLEDPKIAIPINKIDYVSISLKSGDWWVITIGFTQMIRTIFFDNEIEAQEFYESIVEALRLA